MGTNTGTAHVKLRNKLKMASIHSVNHLITFILVASIPWLLHSALCPQASLAFLWPQLASIHQLFQRSLKLNDFSICIATATSIHLLFHQQSFQSACWPQMSFSMIARASDQYLLNNNIWWAQPARLSDAKPWAQYTTKNNHVKKFN